MRKFLVCLAAMTALAVMLCGGVCAAETETEDLGYIVQFEKGYIRQSRKMHIMSAETEKVLEPVVEEMGIYKVSEDNLSEIDMSKVKHISKNRRMYPMDNTAVGSFVPNDPFYRFNYQWNLPLVNVSYAWDRGFFGEGVTVAFIDSGIDINHPDLKNKIVAYHDYTDSDIGIAESSLHGTSTSGVLAAEINNGLGVAGITKANVVMLKVTNSAQTREALYDAVTKYGCSVINISLGFAYDGDSRSEEAIEEEKESDNEYLKVITTGIDVDGEPIVDGDYNGAIIVASSGNWAEGYTDEDTDIVYINPVCYPAANEHVISVGSVGSGKGWSAFSTFNNMVDVTAPGEEIITTLGNYTSPRDSSRDYCRAGGTSFSAPHVAAAAAIVKGIRPQTTQSEMERLIKYSSEDLGEMGRDNYYGWGLLNIENLVKLVSNEEAPFKSYPPVYNRENKTVEISYLKTSELSAGAEPQVRVAVYNGDGTLAYISDAKLITAEVLDEQSLKFEGIDVPNGGYAKIFCTENMSGALVPLSSVASFS